MFAVYSLYLDFLILANTTAHTCWLLTQAVHTTTTRVKPAMKTRASDLWKYVF